MLQLSSKLTDPTSKLSAKILLTMQPRRTYETDSHMMHQVACTLNTAPLAALTLLGGLEIAQRCCSVSPWVGGTVHLFWD